MGVQRADIFTERRDRGESESSEGHRVSGMMREKETTLLLGFFLRRKQMVLVTESGEANP